MLNANEGLFQGFGVNVIETHFQEVIKPSEKVIERKQNRIEKEELAENNGKVILEEDRRVSVSSSINKR